MTPSWSLWRHRDDRKPHCRDKTISWMSYVHNGISYSGKTTSVHCITAPVLLQYGRPVAKSEPCIHVATQVVTMDSRLATNVIFRFCKKMKYGMKADRWYWVMSFFAMVWAMLFHTSRGVMIETYTVDFIVLTHWGRDKMDAISQTTFSNTFSWMKMHEFRLRFHWRLLLRFELTIFQHWFR